MSQTIFIADLHLSEHSPELTELFLRQLHQWQSTADALYILGDLFDAWVGDDDRTPFTDHIAAELKAFAQHKPVYFIPGNRDFLLGQDFASRSGMTLLPEQHPLTLYGRPYLLTCPICSSVPNRASPNGRPPSSPSPWPNAACWHSKSAR